MPVPWYVVGSIAAVAVMALGLAVLSLGMVKNWIWTNRTGVVMTILITAAVLAVGCLIAGIVLSYVTWYGE